MEGFPFSVEIIDDVIHFFWDAGHPVTSVFNDWTSEDFRECILEHCKRILVEHGDEDGG